MSDPNIRPNVDRVSGVPSCTETCPSHDGKRCRVLGLKAGGICEPAVIDIVVALRKTNRGAQTMARESADRAMVAASERGECGTCGYAPCACDQT